jgi:hypothetical protein
MMHNTAPAADPDAYVAALGGWQQRGVAALRQAVLECAPLEERIRWGHLVYFARGPVLLIRAEPSRLLFGFWRGRRLTAIEPRLKGGGKYEMATLVLHEDTALERATAMALVRAAVALDRQLGDPTRVAA